MSEPKVLLLDECFAALDVLTIKMLQQIIVNLQNNSGISIILCDHQARDLLNCVDTALIINNGKVIAQGTPSNLIQNICQLLKKKLIYIILLKIINLHWRKYKIF